MDSLAYVIDKYHVDTSKNSPIFIPNFKRDELSKLFNELGFKTGAEIGVERGIFAEQLCKNNPELKLFCVDSWKIYDACSEYAKQEELDTYFAEAKARLFDYNCQYIKKQSMEAVTDFQNDSLDFVYIDANHRFDFVVNDIIAWSHKVKPGGIISGHDYALFNMSRSIKYDIVEATNAYTSAHQIKPWFVFEGERSASWFWVKS